MKLTKKWKRTYAGIFKAQCGRITLTCYRTVNPRGWNWFITVEPHDVHIKWGEGTASSPGAAKRAAEELAAEFLEEIEVAFYQLMSDCGIDPVEED